MADQKTTKRRSGMPGRGGHPAFSGGEKAKDFKTGIKNLIKYLAPYKARFVLVFVFAIGSTVFSVVSPKILGNVTNDLFNDYIPIMIHDRVATQMAANGMEIPKGMTIQMVVDSMDEQDKEEIPSQLYDRFKDVDISVRGSIDFDSIKQMLLTLGGMYVISMVFNVFQAWIMARVAQQVAFNLRKDVAAKLNKLPLKYFDSNTFGDVLSRITNDVDSVSQSLNQSLAQIITSVATILGILIMMFSISWELTLVALLILPISMAFVSFVVKKSQNLFKRQRESLGQINGHIEETYAGHNIVRAYNAEENVIEKFSKINVELADSSWKSQFISTLLFPIMRFIGNLGYVGVAVIGGWLAFMGKLLPGDIQAFIQYLQQFNQPVTQAANIMNVLQSTVAASERVFEFIEEEEEVPDPKDARSLEKVKGDIKFDSVVFGYEKTEPVIKNVSINVKAGQQVAIVGPTGAGKTTIVNLLMRFYDVDSGNIYVDGVDIRDFKRNDLRRLFGMVLQDTWLFSGTIRENIAYSNVDAAFADIEAAAKAAHADHFIKSLPDGYDMLLNESSDNVSQGEKQLITIARAMLLDPPILILDEATSSVDTRTELLIQKAMENLLKGRTSFVIAHRLSTIKNADLVLVMKEGNIIEQGTHNELLAQDGFYAQLYNSQFAG